MKIDYRKLYQQEKRKIIQQKKEGTTRAATSTSNVAAESIPICNSPSFAQFSPIKVNALSRQHDQLESAGVFYKPRFLEDLEFQIELIRWLQGLPANSSTRCSKASGLQKNEALEALGRWTYLQHAQRRVALFDARHQPIPTPLQLIVDTVGQYFADSEPPNHLLINEYEPHQGIMPHTDGPAYAARTATISLGSGSVLLHFTGMKDFQVVLDGHGSLVLFEGEAYSSFKHSINENCSVEYANSTCQNAEDGAAVRRDYRISITIRHMYTTTS